jgi:hypothetical protein
MPNDFIDAYVVYGFISVLAFIILLVSIDRFLTRRRSTVLNAEYLARVQSQTRNFGTFQSQSQSRTTRLPFAAALAELPWELEAVHVTGSSRSRTRVLRDRLGRTVATHYEEIVAGDFYVADGLWSRAQPLRYLPAARA